MYIQAEFGGEAMFNGNWVLYLFILMLIFGRDGEIEGTELWVLIASALAVLLTDENCGLCAGATTNMDT